MAFRFRNDSKTEFENLGYSDLQWDVEIVQPPQGFAPIKTVPYPESVWDKAHWPNTEKQPNKLIMKGHAKKTFLLGDKDLEDLVYLYVKAGTHMAKKFLHRQVERRAWEKYGGPSGWQAAARMKASKAHGTGGEPVLPATKDGIVKDGLANKGLATRAPAAIPRIKPQTTSTIPTPSVASAAAPAVQAEKPLIPSTPRKHGKLLRLHTHPGLSTPPYDYPKQDNVAGPSTPSHARISARQNLAGPSLSTPTQSSSSQRPNIHRSPSSAIFALDFLAARSPAASPAKRRRESEPGPSTPTVLKRPRLFIINSDDDDHHHRMPPRTPTPPLSPVKQKAPHTPTPLSSFSKGKLLHTPPSPVPTRKTSRQDDSDVLELTGSEDDYIPMSFITPKKSKGASPKKQLAAACDNAVIEISD